MPIRDPHALGLKYDEAGRIVPEFAGSWCQCIYGAHCHPAKAGRCKLRAGGTTNEGGGVCPPRQPDAVSIDSGPADFIGISLTITDAMVDRAAAVLREEAAEAGVAHTDLRDLAREVLLAALVVPS